jgi:sirohydrochlorin cobaltochelatase
MTSESSSNLLVLVGYGSDGPGDFAELDQVGQAIAERLHLSTQSALLEATDTSIGERILKGITQHRPQHLITLPLLLGASPTRHNTIRQIVEAAQDRWPEIAMIYGQPPGVHVGVVAAYTSLLHDMIATLNDPAYKTALLLVGRGSRGAASSDEARQMTQLIAQKSALPFMRIETAFLEIAQPSISTAFVNCLSSGVERVLVVPYVLYEKAHYESICQEIDALRADYPSLEMCVTAHLGLHEGMIAAIAQGYNEALTDLIDREASGVPRSHGHTHGPKGHAMADVSPLNAMLPPRYQDNSAVSAAPMGAADLVFDANGQVAWDEIWGSFCDLALAGGPPHRGTLLEPVTPDVVTADPEGYARVLAELARGITLITHLPIIASAAPGWIGVQCTDEAMALWLLRAIIVENVSVRREGVVLYLPAGPQFRIDQEIKNVITVIAKTHHYWIEHLTNQTNEETNL